MLYNSHVFKNVFDNIKITLFRTYVNLFSIFYDECCIYTFIFMQYYPDIDYAGICCRNIFREAIPIWRMLSEFCGTPPPDFQSNFVPHSVFLWKLLQEGDGCIKAVLLIYGWCIMEVLLIYYGSIIDLLWKYYWFIMDLLWIYNRNCIWNLSIWMVWAGIACKGNKGLFLIGFTSFSFEL